MAIEFKGVGQVGGVAEGHALVTTEGIAFNLGVAGARGA